MEQGEPKTKEMYHPRGIDLMSYDEILESFFTEFKERYGQVKFDKYIKKIATSKRVNLIMKSTNNIGRAPTSNEFLGVVNTTGFFFNATGIKLAVATLMAVLYWHEKVNDYREYLDADDMNRLARNIADRAMATSFRE